MSKLATTCFVLLFTKFAIGQTASRLLYKDFIFEKATITKNLYYTKNIPPNVKKKSYKFDFYQPEKDSSKQRPLVIWLHGGGFKFGSKKARGIPTWSKTFARRGYVCAAINYRKSKKKPLKHFTDLAEGCFYAIRDAEQAISYFKDNSATYGIDTNKIILAGNSAGAIVALQAVYSTPAELATYTGQQTPDTIVYTNNFKNIAGVINFWGAIFDTTWLKHASVPIVSVHGTGDNLVPYAHKDAPLYGSLLIHKEADALGIPNALKPYEGFRHELQKRFNPILAGSAAHRRWLEAGEFAAAFLQEQLTK